MKLVIASGNEHKIKEIKAILSPYFEDIISASTAGFEKDVEENGSTFTENALIKARAVCKALNCAALADDSGICVDALGGLPGVYSARYSGGGDRENNLKLV
jgi:XTP/dITP diphosphohydrolase